MEEIAKREFDARPWKRYFAKVVDMAVYSSLVEFGFDLAGLHLPGIWSLVAISVVTGIILLILEPVMLTRFGATPGKLLFNIRISNSLEGSLPQYGTALKRTLEM